jgi:hypothetical protein
MPVEAGDWNSFVWAAPRETRRSRTPVRKRDFILVEDFFKTVRYRQVINLF